MRQRYIQVIGLFAAMALAATLLAACASATAPAPAAPTAAAAAPGKAAEPAKPAAQATAVPVPKVNYPEKGRTLSIIVAFDAGSASDLVARMLQPYLETELGIPVQVIDKPGAGGQVGVTDLAKAKPDGYTIGYTPLPNMITLVEDKQRNASFTRKDFQPLAMDQGDSGGVGVLNDSPFKSVKDIVDAAKANPKKVRVGITGIGGPIHLELLQWQKVADVQFAPVMFDSGSLVTTALLGKNVDVKMGGLTEFEGIRDRARLLAIVGKEEYPAFPGIKTMEAQGYPVSMITIRAISMPAGAPKEVIDTLAGALGRALQNPEHVKKLTDAKLTPRYGDPAAFAAMWDEYERDITPLMPLLQVTK